jgi:hypothetical protein
MRSSGFLPSRDVAQPGRALAWGARGRQFKSARPDHSILSSCGVYSSTNQEKHFDPEGSFPDNRRKLHLSHARRRAIVEAVSRSRLRVVQLGGILMSGQVILYFEDQADALRFALAAGSVMAGDSAGVTDDLVQETARVSRIRLDAANAGKIKKPNPERAA